jgi:hypothetical protein
VPKTQSFELGALRAERARRQASHFLMGRCAFGAVRKLTTKMLNNLQQSCSEKTHPQTQNLEPKAFGM